MHSTLFIQSPPMLGNQYGDDTFLRSYLQRRLPAEVLAAIEPALRARIQQGISATVHNGAQATDARLAEAGQQALAAVEHVARWLSHNADLGRLQAHARRVAMTLGRALELALLVEHADETANAGDVAAARRFAATPVDMLIDIKSEDSARLIE